MKNRRVAWMFIALSIVSMAIGLYRKENLIVLHKAIKICLECIGIG